MTWFQSEIDCFEDAGSGDMKSSGDMTKASSVPYLLFNQVEIASVVLTKGSSVGLLYLLFNQVEIASVVLTKASSVDLLYLPFNQVEIASVGNKSQEMETEIEKKVTSHFWFL